MKFISYLDALSQGLLKLEMSNFDYMGDIFGCEQGGREILLKIPGNAHIVTNTATISFLIKVLAICEDLQADHS